MHPWSNCYRRTIYEFACDDDDDDYDDIHHRNFVRSANLIFTNDSV